MLECDLLLKSRVPLELSLFLGRTGKKKEKQVALFSNLIRGLLSLCMEQGK